MTGVYQQPECIYSHGKSSYSVYSNQMSSLSSIISVTLKPRSSYYITPLTHVHSGRGKQKRWSTLN